MKKSSYKFILSGVFFALFLVLIALIKTYDVAAIGPEETEIGFSHLNGAVHEFFGYSKFWYFLTQIFGLLAIGVVLQYAVAGAYQLIKRKSLARVDAPILLLGGLYIVVFGLYGLFEKVIINYRPIIEEDAEHVEASFPSSHTMLVCVVMGALILMINKYRLQASSSDRLIIRIIAAVVIVLTVIGRLVCGVHWFTDILGGVLISATLLFLFSGLLDKIEIKR
ncbi:phosphatase PAP2 family protein [Butyrivibrio proteoclasticus]|nr:phosphatase PAP2 family protein [Butyrivibrio proteoclasticus]